MTVEALDVNRNNVWIAARIVGLGALGLAAALWIFYMAIAPATESELETVEGIVVYRSSNGGSRSSDSRTQTLTIKQPNGEEASYTAPLYPQRVTRSERLRLFIQTGDRVTLKVTDYGYVYAAEVRGKTFLSYTDGRAFYASRRIIPGILATTATLLATVMALLSRFGPVLVDGESKFAQR